VLRGVAEVLQEALRLHDVPGRYGGEEFGLILPGCDLDVAVGIVDRLRELTPEGETSSAGVAGWDGTETADALVARADRALYAAKHGGRDRTVLADAAGDLLAA